MIYVYLPLMQKRFYERRPGLCYKRYFTSRGSWSRNPPSSYAADLTAYEQAVRGDGEVNVDVAARGSL